MWCGIDGGRGIVALVSSDDGGGQVAFVCAKCLIRSSFFVYLVFCHRRPPSLSRKWV